MKTVDAARHHWVSIHSAFGIEENYLQNKHGDCPCCGGKDRYRYDNKNGTGSYFCSGCGAGDGFSLLMKFTGRPFADLAKEIDEIIGNVAKDTVPQRNAEHGNARARLTRIGKNLKTVDRASPVSAYLARRGLIPFAGEHLRYHPAMRYYERGKHVGTFPAMVAAYTSPEGAIESFHATHLTADGHKAPVSNVRKSMTPINGLNGCAIRLSPVTARIGLAEGIETALAVTKLFGVACWATGNAGLMEKFEPPAGVECVSIYADNDANFRGQRAAYTAANRLAESFQVEIFIPERIGTDYADELQLANECAA